MAVDASLALRLSARAFRFMAAALSFVTAVVAAGVGLVLNFIGYEDSSYPYDAWADPIFVVSAFFLVVTVWLLFRIGPPAPPPAHEGDGLNDLDLDPAERMGPRRLTAPSLRPSSPSGSCSTE